MILYPISKINIGLNVTERRQDGYHNLETVFYPINLMDALEIKTITDEPYPECGYNLKVGGTILEGTPEDNLVVKALNLIKKDYDIPPVNIYIYKHIPTGAGLGGGSSDAAYTIKMLNEKYRLEMSNEKMEAYASKLGADCAFFIKNQPVFASGIGNIFSKISLNLSGMYLLLIKPDIFISTRDAYANIHPHKPTTSLTELIKLPIKDWKGVIVNDFEASVFPKYSEIAAIKDRLYDIGAIYASMSGSGSSVYGIFDKPVEHAEEIFSGYFCRQREL